MLKHLYFSKYFAKLSFICKKLNDKEVIVFELKYFLVYLSSWLWWTQGTVKTRWPARHVLCHQIQCVAGVSWRTGL